MKITQYDDDGNEEVGVSEEELRPHHFTMPPGDYRKDQPFRRRRLSYLSQSPHLWPAQRERHLWEQGTRSGTTPCARA